LTDAVAALAPADGVMTAACAALGVSRASVQRRRARLAAPAVALRPRPRPARALSVAQQQAVLDLLHAPRVEPRGSPDFADQAPAEIYACLLDEGVYHCSVRTMYRLLGQNGEIRERREQLRHPVYQKPELLAERPNEVWSWDITKLTGAPSVCRVLSRRLGYHLAARSPAVTAKQARRLTARIRPAARQVPGDQDGPQGEAPVLAGQSACQ